MLKIYQLTAIIFLFPIGGAVDAAPADFFGVDYQNAATRIKKFYNCSDVRELSRTWICKTKINLGKNRGLAKLEVTIFYRSSGGVSGYRFSIPKRRLIRSASFGGMLSFADYFGKDVGKNLRKQETYDAYVSGQDVFFSNGFQFEVFDTSSSYRVDVRDKTNPSTRPTIGSNLTPYSDECRQTFSMAGWQASWSENHSAIEPDIIPTNLDLPLVAGKFNFGKDGVHVSFNGVYNKSGRLIPKSANRYVTVFADNEPIYQGEWVKKTKPTCCSSSVLPKMSSKVFFGLSSGKQGAIMISHDKELKKPVAAGVFSLKNIGKSAEKAIRGRLHSSKMKSIGACK